ncbi:MAG: ATP-binding protein, partial [Anaerotignaceae bacterium]
QIKKLLQIATEYGFNENLWHNYLTFLIITDENPFSLISEKIGAKDGSVNDFVLSDFKIFRELFHLDFSKIEEYLNIDCFSKICNYKAIEKKEFMYNKNVGDKIQSLSKKLYASKDENEFFQNVTDFYKDYGVGMFGLNKAFRIQHKTETSVDFCAINNLDKVMLDDLVGYELQKQKLIDNTKAFVEGRKANNCLLFGDSGTGKSTCIKAIINTYYEQGLRMVEINKYQFRDLATVITQLKNRNYKFIIYMDDLSFEREESEYKFLKAVIEGGLETKPSNILIYATSNRRHLIREVWNDRNDIEYQNEIHHSDTMEEMNSLVNRFGVQISFSKPSKVDFNTIVKTLADREGINLDEKELLAEANKWEISHGGRSGRTAQQFINYVLGTLNADQK